MTKVSYHSPDRVPRVGCELSRAPGGVRFHLSDHGVDLQYRPTLTDAEYRTITSGRAGRKAATLSRAP